MLTKTFATTLIALTLVACGGNSEEESGAGTGGSGTGGKSGVGGSSSGGASTGGSSTGGASTGGVSTGGTGGAETGGAAGAPSGGTGGGECVPAQGGSGGSLQPSCNDLSHLAVTDPKVEDSSGDGSVSPGEEFTIAANLTELSGVEFMYYPGVHFTSDNPEVKVTDDFGAFGILACESFEVHSSGTVSNKVAPGTVITITARVGMLNTDCPNAPSIQIPITVQ